MTPYFNFAEDSTDSATHAAHIITSHHNYKNSHTTIIYSIQFFAAVSILLTNRFFIVMPSHTDIDAARLRGDVARAAAMGLSADEGALASVAAVQTPTMNLFAAAFGEFTTAPAAGGVGGRGRLRGLQVEHTAGRGGRSGRGRGNRGGNSGRGRGNHGGRGQGWRGG